MAVKLFDPWKPLFGGYMPLSLLVSYRRDRGGLLATVLLEMYVADRLSQADLRRARLTLPAHMPDAYDSLPVVLDDLIAAGEAVGHALSNRQLQRPRTSEEALKVRDVVVSRISELVEAPVIVRWQFPRHLRPPGELGEDTLGDVVHDDPPVRSELVIAVEGMEDELEGPEDEESYEGDDDSIEDELDDEWAQADLVRRTASVATGASASRPSETTQSPSPPFDAVEPTAPESPGASGVVGRVSRRPQVQDPFSGAQLRPAAGRQAPSLDSEEGEGNTLVVNPGDLAARIDQVNPTQAAVGFELGAVRGFDVGEPAAELSLDSEDLAASGVTLPLDDEPVSAGLFPRDLHAYDTQVTATTADSPHLRALLGRLESALLLDPEDEGGLEDLLSWHAAARGAVQEFAEDAALAFPVDAPLSRVPLPVLVRAVEGMLAVQERVFDLVRDRADAERQGAPESEATLSCLVAQMERLGEGQPPDEQQMGQTLSGFPAAVKAVRRLESELSGLRRRQSAPRGSSEAAPAAPADAALRWELAEREREAKSLRILAAWGQLRALLAELREEVAEAVEPRELFGRVSGDDAERGRQLLSKWEEVQRFMGVLEGRLPMESMAPYRQQILELAPFMEALAGQESVSPGGFVG